jgi:hypothetical protein
MKTQNDILSYMKTACSTIICLTALALNSALSQPSSPQPLPLAPSPQPLPSASPGGSFSERLQNIIQKASNPLPEPILIKFDLDFPGGTPKELVAAIQKALGRPLNAIIPEELAATKLPALKMNSVDVSELFKALTAASRKTETVLAGTTSYGVSQYQYVQTACGFRQGTEGRLSDDSIWYFYVEKPNPPPPPLPSKIPTVCRFYSLTPYLDRGLSVDDITTAIQTGWKMLGEMSPPTISFHKDTKLLIAVGEEGKLETISDVLRALEPPMTRGGGGGFGGGFQPPKPKIAAPAPAPATKKAERPETGQ